MSSILIDGAKAPGLFFSSDNSGPLLSLLNGRKDPGVGQTNEDQDIIDIMDISVVKSLWIAAQNGAAL